MKEDIRTKVSEVVDERKKDSFTHVPETWAVATESQRETQEMEGDKKGKDQDGVQNKERANGRLGRAEENLRPFRQTTRVGR